MFNMQNDDESSIRSGTKSRILMEFPRKLAAVWQCRVYQKQRESILFEYRSSTSPPFPLRRHMHITRILCLRLLLFFFLFLSLFFSIFSSFSLSLPLSRDGLVTARSPPVKSYPVTARNTLCEPTYPFAFTYRSGAVPRTTEEYRPATVQTIENTSSRASLVGGF